MASSVKKKDNYKDDFEGIDPYEVLKGKFTDLTYRMHGICEDNPGILARLIFDLVDDSIQDKEDCIENGYESIQSNIKTVEQIEYLLDLVEEKSKAKVH